MLRRLSPRIRCAQPDLLTRRCLTVGNTANGVVVPKQWTWTEEAAPVSYGPDEWIRAGRLLQILDVAAAHCSAEVVHAASKTQGTRFYQTTVAVTNTLFSAPIHSTDHVRTESNVVHVGNSSIGVYVRLFRDTQNGRVTPAGESFVTMTMITKDARPARFLPAVEFTTDEQAVLHKRYSHILQAQKEHAAGVAARRDAVLSSADVEDPANHEKATKVPVHATRLTVNRLFMQAYVNGNNTIFGGELMAWMEQVALQCGQRFTGNAFLYTLGMHSMEFREPVLTTDFLELEAKVVYVRRLTMEVDVRLQAYRGDGSKVVTNSAAFVLINADDAGTPQPIAVGLDIDGASQEELHAMMNARERYLRSRQRKQQFDERLKREGTHTQH